MPKAKRIAYLARRIIKLMLTCAVSIYWVAIGSSSEGGDSWVNQKPVDPRLYSMPWWELAWVDITNWQSVTDWRHLSVGMPKLDVLTAFTNAVPRTQIKERLAQDKSVFVGTVRPTNSSPQSDTWIVQAPTGSQAGPRYMYARLTFVKDQLSTIEKGFFPPPTITPPLKRLGYPPGKAVTVEGVRCDKCKFGFQMLSVSKVEGKALPEPVVLDLAGPDMPEVDLPENMTIILTGFEKDSQFVVTKIITPKSWKPMNRPDLWSE